MFIGRYNIRIYQYIEFNKDMSLIKSVNMSILHVYLCYMRLIAK